MGLCERAQSSRSIYYEYADKNPAFSERGNLCQYRMAIILALLTHIVLD